MKIGVVGGGIAGLALGREAILNGLDVIIFEKDQSPQGASVNNGALLHSGARYLVDNKRIAKLCFQENKIIKDIANFATGNKLGIFLVEKSLANFTEKSFINNAAEIGMPIRKIDQEELRKKINFLNDNIKYGYETPDVIVNPFILIQSYIEDVTSRGGKILFDAHVIKIKSKKDTVLLEYVNRQGLKKKTEVDFLVNCAGQDLEKVAKIFESNLEVDNIEGSMYVIEEHFSDYILTTCGVNFDGNTIVPINEASSVGSTWLTDKESEQLVLKRVQKNLKRIIDREVTFDLSKTIRGYRTHFKSTNHTRSGIDYGIFDHTKEGIKNIFSILPGKLVLHRLVAEQTLDSILETKNITRGKTNHEPIKTPKGHPKGMIEYIL